MLLSRCIGSVVISPGRPAKLGPFRILCFLHMADNLRVRIFVSTFLAVSIRTIGLVLARLPLHSLFLEIGYMLLCF